MTTGNLPIVTTTGVQSTKQFFDNYFVHHVSFPAGEIDATIGFFQKRGFDNSSSRSYYIIDLIILFMIRDERNSEVLEQDENYCCNIQS